MFENWAREGGTHEGAVGAFVALILGRYFFSFIQKKTLTELRSVHFRRQVAETCLGNTMQRQIAPCTGEFLRKSLFLQQNLVAATWRKKNQIRQNLCGLLRRQKFCCRYNDFHKNSPVHMKRFVTPMCRRNVLLQLVARSVHTEWFVFATCRLVCSELKHRIDQSQSGKLSAWSHAQSSPPNVTFSFEVALSHTLYGSYVNLQLELPYRILCCK